MLNFSSSCLSPVPQNPHAFHVSITPDQVVLIPCGHIVNKDLAERVFSLTKGRLNAWMCPQCWCRLTRAVSYKCLSTHLNRPATHIEKSEERFLSNKEKEILFLSSTERQEKNKPLSVPPSMRVIDENEKENLLSVVHGIDKPMASAIDACSSTKEFFSKKSQNSESEEESVFPVLPPPPVRHAPIYSTLAVCSSSSERSAEEGGFPVLPRPLKVFKECISSPVARVKPMKKSPPRVALSDIEKGEKPAKGKISLPARWKAASFVCMRPLSRLKGNPMHRRMILKSITLDSSLNQIHFNTYTNDEINITISWKKNLNKEFRCFLNALGLPSPFSAVCMYTFCRSRGQLEWIVNFLSKHNELPERELNLIRRLIKAKA